MTRQARVGGLFVAGIMMVLGMLSAFAPTLSAEESPDLSTEQAKTLFLEQVKPMLQAKCTGCHGEQEEIEASLDLRTRKGLLQGGDTGPALVPGKPDESLLFQAILRTGDVVMPPKEANRLTAEETAQLKQWIAAGAPWAEARPEADSTDWTAPAASGRKLRMVTSGGLSEDWNQRTYTRDDVWAYLPLQRAAVPWQALGPQDGRHPIDAFIREKLQSRKLSPAPPADRRTLLKRLSYNLTGLPPSHEDVAEFANDKRPDAYRRKVRELLASAHYGENQARHWLDVVRYADTSGFSNDFERPNAWRYRDYVVRSFNQDKPFDRFIIEQIAGDELDSEDPELLIATGFLRMGPWEHTGMSVAAVTRQLFLDDVTHSVGVTFLAQGMRCCKCHDHKFDPLPTKDYYRLQAVFAPVQFADRVVPYQPYENIAGFAEQKERTRRLLEEAQEYIKRLRQKNEQAVAQLLKEHGVKTVNELPAQYKNNKRFIGLTELELSLEKMYRKRIAYFEREMKRYEPYVFGVYNGPPRNFSSVTAVHKLPAQTAGNIPPIRLLNGGSLEAPGDVVTPGVISAVFGSNDRVRATAWNTVPATPNGRRLALARWIASPNNTLTARVIVNRVWQQHFGTGLVATANSFGRMADRPSHPELLDWLAVWFMDHDWSIKRLHELIVTSATYQQQSQHPQKASVDEVDPNNRLLSYYPPRRLAAEEIRDSQLVIAGLFNPQMGGPGYYPEINWEVAMAPRHIMGSVAPAYQPSPRPEQRHRRTLYAFRYRTLSDPFLDVFDRPGSDISCERRTETTVTPQVFALFNGRVVHDRALALAHDVVQHTGSVAEQIEQVFERVHGRPPNKQERQLALQHVARMTAYHEQHAAIGRELPLAVRREMIEELTGKTFSWEEELDVMREYQRNLQPADVDAPTRGLAELCLVMFNSNEFLYVR